MSDEAIWRNLFGNSVQLRSKIVNLAVAHPEEHHGTLGVLSRVLRLYEYVVRLHG